MLDRRPSLDSFVGEALAPLAPLDELPLGRLIRFLQNPARGLLQQRLGLYLADDPLLVEDREPVELDPLQRYGVGSLLLQQALLDRSEATAGRIARATGQLPHGTPGDLWQHDLWRTACQIVERARPFASDPSEPLRRIELGIAGLTLTGRLSELYASARVRRQFARLKPRDELGLWLEHLLMSACCPDPPRSSVLVGRSMERNDGSDVDLCVFAPLAADTAQEHLVSLVELFYLGQRVPLPFFPHASKTYVEALRKGKEPERALASGAVVFERGVKTGFSEASDESVGLVFAGGNPIFAGSTAYASADGPVRAPSFAELSERVFGPLLEHQNPEAKP